MSVKVILRSDIRNVGKRGDICEVSDGYARNYLLPKKLAIEATAGTKKVVADIKASALRKEAKLKSDAEDLGRLMTAEQGKPLAESLGEVSYSVNYLHWFAEESMRAYGDIIPCDTAGKRIFVLRQPIGVAAAITPWNFPIAMITRKAAPALAAGCGMLIKPSELTPLTAIAVVGLLIGIIGFARTGSIVIALAVIGASIGQNRKIERYFALLIGVALLVVAIVLPHGR